MSVVEIITTDIPHPFGDYRSVNELNPLAFDRLEGCCMYDEGVYEKLSWDANGRIDDVGCDVGPAVNIHSVNLILYESETAYHVVLQNDCSRYVYPKTDFALIRKRISLSAEQRQKI